MNHQTRQLMRLLADEVTDRILQALREGSANAPALVRATGASPKTVAQTVELLAAHGVLEPEQAKAGAAGRPSRLWHLSDDRRLAAFEVSCDEFKGALLREQLAGYDRGPGKAPAQATGSRRRRRVRDA
jgi:predicted ArsR family transcriptional regulator